MINKSMFNGQKRERSHKSSHLSQGLTKPRMLAKSAKVLLVAKLFIPCWQLSWRSDKENGTLPIQYSLRESVHKFTEQFFKSQPFASHRIHHTSTYLSTHCRTMWMRNALRIWAESLAWPWLFYGSRNERGGNLVASRLASPIKKQAKR